MIRVGVVGLGFMGKTHFNCYKSIHDVQVAAVCDVDEKKLKDPSGMAGNLAGAEKPLDFSGVELYTNYDEMLAKAKLDAVSITLPTYMHAEHAIKALKKGLNVMCEKPMALDVAQCKRMISAMHKSGKILQIGHCIRFWPEYVKAKEVIDSGEYGKVKAASFRRLSSSPAWSWNNWMLAGNKSGGALMDLHIHDTDYVQYVFGLPKSVWTRGVFGPSGKLDHITTHYLYGTNDMVITAEGGCIMAPSFGFEMSFNIILERATIAYDCTRHVPFRICLGKGEPLVPDIDKRSGHALELIHFIKRLKGEPVAEVLTPEDSLHSIKLILAEERSAITGKEIKIK
ncbi:MAG: Gfo/Idh/MocA family oxidoreductase [Verrucomicrobiota bacterium]